MSLSWMAWTYPTAIFFLLIAASIGVMIILELKYPGGNPRKGIFGIDTTRGDRLFISILGSTFIALAWLFFIGIQLLWVIPILIVIWFFVVFRWV
jgi:predicted small integral membrane protein